MLKKQVRQKSKNETTNKYLLYSFVYNRYSKKRIRKMAYDKKLNELTKVLGDYIKEINYTLKTKPYSTNMTLDDEGTLKSLPEHQIFATAENEEGLTVSLSIIPSKNAIFIEDELVREL
jgi:hypothetical protein